MQEAAALTDFSVLSVAALSNLFTELPVTERPPKWNGGKRAATSTDLARCQPFKMLLPKLFATTTKARNRASVASENYNLALELYSLILTKCPSARGP